MRKGKQLRLFLPKNPLAAKTWDHFFKSLPNKAGVYLFYGYENEVLYVGKSKQLKKRLSSYRQQLDRMPSTKTKRLVCKVATIAYTILSSELHALLEEDRLIKKLQPKYNRANTQSDTYYYYHLKSTSLSLSYDLSLSMQALAESDGICFGAYKGHFQSRKVLGAIMRQISFLESFQAASFKFPVQLLRKLCPYSFKSIIRTHSHNRLCDFLKGLSFRFLRQIEQKAIKWKNYLGSNELRIIEHDLDLLYSFYYKSCKPLTLTSKEKAFTSKNELDQVLIKWGRIPKE